MYRNGPGEATQEYKPVSVIHVGHAMILVVPYNYSILLSRSIKTI